MHALGASAYFILLAGMPWAAKDAMPVLKQIVEHEYGRTATLALSPWLQ